MQAGDKGFPLAGFNGNNPRVCPPSKKCQMPPRPAGARPSGDPAIGQWIAAGRGGPPVPTNSELRSPVAEASLPGWLAQRVPAERLGWDSANFRFTNSARANRYVEPPCRGEYQIRRDHPWPERCSAGAGGKES